jgi:holo-[acyl-carrier protein] synthase
LILGVGTDLVDIGRVKKYLEGASGKRFAERVLTPAERLLAEERKGRTAEFVAGRFAAKEAVVKALGTGIGGVTGFQDIEVLPGPGGRPEAVLSEAALGRLGYGQKELRLHLSITHIEEYASAYAVAELVHSGQTD